MRYAKRIDGNQKAIVSELRAYGFRVRVTSDVGHGFPDLLVWKNKRAVGVEIKVAGKRKQLTAEETEMGDWWQDLGANYLVAESAQEIVEWFKAAEEKQK